MKKIVLNIVILFLTISVSAQVDNIDELLEDQEIKLDNPVISDLLLLPQIQSRNDINTLLGVGEPGSSSAIIMQEGWENTGTIDQNGSGHSTVLLQNGKQNDASLYSSGQLTSTIAIQQGESNEIQSRIDNQGLWPKIALMIQKGSNNSIDLEMTGNGFGQDGFPIAAFINQTGTDLELNAVFDSYKSPLYIKQQSGPSGAGMTLNIKSSDFYFPGK